MKRPLVTKCFSNSTAWAIRLSRSRRARVSILVSLSVLLAAAVIFVWVKQRNAVITTAVTLDASSLTNFSYLEIQLREQEAREPSFKGNFFLYIGQFKGQTSPYLSVKISEGRGYGASILNVGMVREHSADFRSQKREDIHIITSTGSHNFFPFDSSNFDFEVTLDPNLPIQMVRIVNRVPGFLMDSEALQAIRTNNRSIHIKFQLTRDPFVQLLSTVLAIASVVFASLILSIERMEVLATSMASFFFSLWSIRGIMASELRTFPTLLDYWTLALCCLLLIGLTWKLALRK